ncbi:MAG: hypothetical protein HQM00_05710 [Magnetococcales bacterium]|nr:hypothetical protein [Magnetococcales bacterium]
MFNAKDVSRRNFPVAMDGGLFLTTRVETLENNGVQTIYQGFAYPGSQEEDAVWMITQTVVDGGSVTTLFADGSAKFDQVWDDRVTLEYA